MNRPSVITMPPEDDPARAAGATSEATPVESGERLRLPSVRATLAHVFIVVLEVALLFVQYVRMEAVAFELAPDFADVDLGFMYGTHLMGLIWLMIVIFVSYATWECTIRLSEGGRTASRALKITVAFWWVCNFLAMIFEFVLFRMLVQDFDDIGVAWAAELFGALMVAAHQAASFWIMRHVVRELFLPDDPAAAPAAPAPEAEKER